MGKNKEAIIAGIAGAMGGGLGPFLGDLMGLNDVLSAVCAGVISLIVCGIIKLIWK